MPELRIVALGASMTAGTPGFFSPRERPPEGLGNEQSQYAFWMMREKPEWEVLNRGMRGQRTDQIAMRFDYDVTENRPELVIILAGTNDLYQGRSVEEALDGLLQLHARAAARGIRSVACSLPPLNLAEEGLKSRIRVFNRCLEAARDRYWAFCDLYKTLEDPGRSGFMARSPDGVHPGVSGYRRMAEALTHVISSRLRESGAFTNAKM